MSNRWNIRQPSLMAICIFVTGFGCQTLHNAGVPGLEPYLKPDPEKINSERTQRENFAVHRDHEAMYWLLTHKIDNGMKLAEVADVFGEQGEYTDQYKRLKTDGKTQSTDSAYRWGPDSKGYSAVLFFRDGRVVNFDRRDYAEP